MFFNQDNFIYISRLIVIFILFCLAECIFNYTFTNKYIKNNNNSIPKQYIYILRYSKDKSNYPIDNNDTFYGIYN